MNPVFWLATRAGKMCLSWHLGIARDFPANLLWWLPPDLAVKFCAKKNIFFPIKSNRDKEVRAVVCALNWLPSGYNDRTSFQFLIYDFIAHIVNLLLTKLVCLIWRDIGICLLLVFIDLDFLLVHKRKKYMANILRLVNNSYILVPRRHNGQMWGQNGQLLRE